MTPTEVLNEIHKMPLPDRLRLRDELNDELAGNDTNGYSSKEQRFITSMKQKGLITKLPLRKPDDARRRKFKPITVTGEPISETIIRERR